MHSGATDHYSPMIIWLSPTTFLVLLTVTKIIIYGDECRDICGSVWAEQLVRNMELVDARKTMISIKLVYICEFSFIR